MVCKDQMFENALRLNDSIIRKHDFYAAKGEDKSWTECMMEVLKQKRHIPIKPEEVSDRDQKWVRLQANNRIVFCRDHFIGVTRWTENQRLITQYVPDLFMGLRMQIKILNYYESLIHENIGEISRVEQAELVLQAANDVFAYWRSSDDISRQENFRRLDVLAESLNKCRKEEKRRLRDLSRTLSTPHDSRQRVNPGAKAAQTIKALDLTEILMIEMRGTIMPFIVGRHHRLRSELERNIWILESAGAGTEKLFDDLFFRQRKPNERVAHILRKRLLGLIDRLTSIWAAPYYGVALRGRTYLMLALRYIDENRVHSQIKEAISLAIENMRHRYSE